MVGVVTWTLGPTSRSKPVVCNRRLGCQASMRSGVELLEVTVDRGLNHTRVIENRLVAAQE
jgi:hypothetical protein